MRTQRAALISAALVTLAAIADSVVASAQATGASAADSVFRRAQRLANDGNTSAGRALADSVLAASPEGTPAYVDALYWRAMLAESAEQARRDYLRIAVEFSLSSRAEDALLRLAQLELTRGDRAAAKRHLERLALEHATGASRAQGLYWMGRVLLEEGAVSPACTSLAEAKSRTARGDVELANQIAYYARPCAAIQRTADSLRADSVSRADAARADSIAKAAAKTDTPAKSAGARGAKESPRSGIAWSVQVAAYATKEDADRLAKRLVARGHDVRVTIEKPFRVRIGRFAKREEAVALAQTLKAARTPAIVVEAEKP